MQGAYTKVIYIGVFFGSGAKLWTNLFLSKTH
jgi:hypothetical protein